MAGEFDDTLKDIDPSLTQHGKLSFVAIPARDPITSAVFYEAVFGWTLSPPDDVRVSWTLGPRDNERVPFADVASGLVGAFTADRGPAKDGPLLHIYVDGIRDTVREIEARGCEVVEGVHTEHGIQLAQFRDPGGNTMGVWELAHR
ncbi:MAG: VOC family protein [Dehalococcoidia bacterium]|nr:VOC family protein [Dehalococcoidia bacterium]MCB9610550.1 VOC family protein [Polyangiaceae bacterium]